MKISIHFLVGDETSSESMDRFSDGFFAVPCFGLVSWTPRHGCTDCTGGSVKFFLVRTTFSDDLFGEGAELWDDFFSCFLKKGQGK